MTNSSVLMQTSIDLLKGTAKASSKQPKTYIQQIYDIISNAWADSTKEVYGSGLLIFHIFCDSKSIPEVQRAPANPTLISAFLSTLTGLYSGSTISNYLHGVRVWHIIHSQSKFTLVTLSSFDLKLHICQADVSIVCNCQGLEVHNFHLPHTKSSPSCEDINWAKQHGQSDPYTALENHFKINGPPAEGPLFTYWQGKGHRPLTKKKFLLTLSSMPKKASIKPLNGHMVKVKGRWASNAFLTYLCRHAQILAPYMQAQPAMHESFICYTIPPIHN
ncbi:hypothetical protein BDN67DRAFT_985360 [Paxillus ammoniavirescens]|nr:hypothetical protein BDN67DRAFT_985360 [Paxillus ammoniavirescens]